ncbi:hypothetical protein ACWT_3413 [Actinoplanes sp. SE50]|uniref:WXG100-like domain-containing protein n=1 Tax=unclassified Actinoplanes TaxID=2626549 RepID=UPI00023ED431|nr:MULTISPECIES: hypothetical protein [unclassified Actinoplanes]AEV84436.1 hypothetical protein ACPL_3541 [Actinoplanes sp. SE50/110]ATO82828.1 hypothetical protein ACWT_3413 [Actinoplanes sp. SE50]SLM00236.1 hypothetical protein ACSP50_3468 [Actinoplanes sp. SE50/110]
MAGGNGVGSVIDTVLDEFLDFFRECEQWVPILGPVLEMLVDIPEGRELELYDLADAYGRAADLHRQHSHEVQALLGDLTRTWLGDGAATKTHERLQKYLEQVNADADAFGQMQQMVSGAALSVEAAKMMDVVNLAMLAMATFEVIMTIIETVGLSAIGEGLAIATCRQAIKTALKELVDKLIKQGFKGALTAALKAGAWRGLQFAAFTAGTKLGIMGIQQAEGHDPLSHFDGYEFAGEVTDSFFAGFLGGPLAMGGHNPLTEAGAMALGQLGDNYLRLYRDDLFDALGGTDWAKEHGLYVDRDSFNPLDGVATAGLFGGVLGAKGMRGGIRDAGADLRLRLGENNAFGEIGTPGAEPGVGSAGDTGVQAGTRPAADHGAGGSEQTSAGTGLERSTSSPGADQQSRGESGDRAGTEPGQRSESTGGGKQAEAGGGPQRAEAGTGEQRSGSGDTARDESPQASGKPEQTSGGQSGTADRGDQRVVEPDGGGRQETGHPDRFPEAANDSDTGRGDMSAGSDRAVPERAADGSDGGADPGREVQRPGDAANGHTREVHGDSLEGTAGAGRDAPAVHGARSEGTGDGRPADAGVPAYGRHAEIGGPRIPEPAAARSAVPETAFSSGEPALPGAPEMAVPRTGELGRTDLPAHRPADISPGDTTTSPRSESPTRSSTGPERQGGEPASSSRAQDPRGDITGTNTEGGRPERPTRDDDPGRTPPRNEARDQGNRSSRRDYGHDDPRRRASEPDGRRWQDYAQRIQRWSENRAADQAAMDRALFRRFKPEQDGTARLRPETVQRVLGTPADRLDGTGQRFKQMVEQHFTDPAFKDGQPVRRPASPDDIAARLGELRTSRPPSLTGRLLHIDKLRGMLPELPRRLPQLDPIHSEHVIGGEYHGFGRPADTVSVSREMREAVPEVLDRLFKNVQFSRPEDGAPDVIRTGEGHEIKLNFGAESMDRKDVGTSTRGGDNIWQVRANSGARPEHISTVTSHELAEILQAERLQMAGETMSPKKMLIPKDTGARKLSPDDHGRIAEMLDWHERSLNGEAGARDRLGELVDHLGLRGDELGAVARRGAVTEMLDNPSAHHFNDAAAGRLSDLLQGAPEDLPAAPERRRFAEDDLRAIPDDLAQRLGIEIRPRTLQDGKILQMEAHQQTLQKIRLHVEGDPVDTFRAENGKLQNYGHDGRPGFASNDPFRKPQGWDVVNSKQRLPDHPHDAANADLIVKDSAVYRELTVELNTASADRTMKLDSVNAILDAVRSHSRVPAELLEPVTTKDVNADNLEETIQYLKEKVAPEHPELRPHIDALEQSATTWSKTYYRRTLASNRIGMIAGREFACDTFRIRPEHLTGDVQADPKAGELDIWGLGRDEHGRPTLVVVEAKGGGAGTGGRLRLQQGSGPYLELIMRLDPKFQAFLRDNPAIAGQLRTGVIKVEYYLVSQGHEEANGVVPDAKVSRFMFDGVDPGNIFDPGNIEAPRR